MQSGKAKPTQDRAEAAGHQSSGLARRRSGWRRHTVSAGAGIPYSPAWRPAPEPGRSSTSPGYRRGRLSRRVEAAPRHGYESAAGQVSRGGSYGKAPGEGRGASTVAISRLTEHFWHSWDPQEFASWSQGDVERNDQDPETGAVPGMGRAGLVRREVGEAWEGKAAP